MKTKNIDSCQTCGKFLQKISRHATTKYRTFEANIKTTESYLVYVLVIEMTRKTRVANPVHFRPEPDPANQNPDADPTGTYQESIQTS